VIGKIFNNTHYWRSVLLPGDAAEAAGLTCRTYDADLDNESEPDTNVSGTCNRIIRTNLITLPGDCFF
jgi:hypothetical protein